MRLILASASPRRRELLAKLGVPFEVIPSRADENETARSPEELVKKLALKKAEEVYSEAADPCAIVLGADTVVAAEGRILGKPKDEAEAREYFRFLCGRTHSAITGVAIIGASGKKVFSETTRVTFGPYDEDVIERYISSGSPLDKAGGYGAQDEGIKPIITRIEGGADNAIGLPVETVRKTLEEDFQWQQWT